MSTSISRADPPRATASPSGDLAAAVEAIHDKCGIYTNAGLVRKILDAAAWTRSADLEMSRLLEPAAGNGEFVVEAAARLVESLRRRGLPVTAAALSDRIRAFEFHAGAAAEARRRVEEKLLGLGLSLRTARRCVNSWIVEGDFILTDLSNETFTHVVGNPPYIRWSKIPAPLKALYDDLLPKDVTGGDLFVPFLDRSLELLAENGRCGFVCSDRWKFMAFSRAFRRKWLPCIDILSETPTEAAAAFVSSVDVYPTILAAAKRPPRRCTVSPLPQRSKPEQTLSGVGYKIRVGPALGHTPAFVLQPDEADVEPERLQPWVDASEIREGEVNWTGRHVITLYDDDVNLIDLARYPLLTARLKKFKSTLEARAIVRSGAPWYRTIDRVSRSVWQRPKLLVPELARVPRLAIDRSGLIPSHGVYAIFAPDDDVDSLYESLRDGQLARRLEGISPKIKGGYFRCYRRFLLKVPI